jgi:alpha-beta hydrolase superfamily lysophospholipase
MRKRRLTSRGPLTAAGSAALIAAGAALVAACSSSPAPGGAHGPDTTSASGTAHGTAAPGTQVTGKLANGTTWVAEYPAGWNGTLVLYSHGYGPLTAADAPDAPTQAAMLAAGYAIAGSSYDPNGSQWALNTAVNDQFGALAAVTATVLPRQPAHVLAFGNSMGGLVSALEAQDGQGKIDGALTTCGVVGGGVNLDEYQLEGEYAIAQLLGSPRVTLVGLNDESAYNTATALNSDAQRAQSTPAGRARLALAMAFLNIPAWDPSSWAPVAAGNPAGQETAQYDALTDSSNNVLDFIEGGRESIEQAVGQAAWTGGMNFAQVLANSPYRQEVDSLYQAAGLNLQADLATLSTHATIVASPAALAALKATSDPTGRLAVPELDLHTIGDNLVPVGNEDYYAKRVSQAGSAALLQQAYTESFGHCNFSVSEQVAGLEALLQRVATGQWGSVATAASLEQRATALKLDPAHFVAYSPAALTGAVPGS